MAAMVHALLVATSFNWAVAAGGDWVRLEPDVQPHDPATSSWARFGRVPPDHVVELMVALRVDADREAELERVLLEVSDPDHANYGKHLTEEEVARLLAVPPERVEAAEQYFTEAGGRVERSPSGDMLKVRMSASAAEAALRTVLHLFQHTERKSIHVTRAGAPYYLPARIARHVEMVGELLQFPRLKPGKLFNNDASPVEWQNSCNAQECNNLVTPYVLAARYKYPKTSEHTEGNSMSVAEFQGQYYIKSDLQGFNQGCNQDVEVAKDIGQEGTTPGVESELDVEYIKAVAPEIPLTVVYDENYSLLKWVTQITALKDSPLVHSVSYGNDEAQQTSTEYMRTCNRGFMKAGVKGLSILFASGDQGVCGREGCEGSGRFHPDFPGASPYVTAVGGTDFEGSDVGPETAWSSGGGGFSDTFGIPKWQAAAVAAYKASPDANLPPQDLWNNTGRGYPDVAALGGQKNPYCIYTDGQFGGVAGTSAACPVVAGIFAKLNGLRLKAGKSPLGFLNPFIYKHPHAFQDVQSGCNNEGSDPYGFTAVKGWDAATGLGTPNYEALAQAVMAASAEKGEGDDWEQQEPDASLHREDTSSWAKVQRADGDQMLRLTVSLRVDADKLEALERVFSEVSDPDHPSYGKYLSREEITSLLAVPEERVKEVLHYLAAAGAADVAVAPNRDMITVSITAARAEAAFNTQLHVFQHVEHTRARVVRASAAYFLPKRISQHVSMVGELLQFPRLVQKKLFSKSAQQAEWKNSCDSAECENLVTPSVIAKRYKLPEQSANVMGNSMSVAEFQGQFWKKSDLQTFGASCHRDVKVDKTVGEEEPTGGVESELDIEYIKAVAPEIPLTVIYDSQYSLLNWVKEVNSMTNPPLVHSVSYGNDEAQQSSTEYMLTCNTGFMKAGARGLSILFASGDQGVCGREGCGLIRKHFHPDFPAASPYVTAVGGTDFEGSDIGPETAWSSGGGGFSDTFGIPKWQAAAVAAYKASPDAQLPPQKMWNNTGRGYPDVAALGGQKNPYCIYVNGQFNGVAGTSAACPVVAGIFAKLNGLRLKAGKAPLGFLNPLIYKNPKAFQDVASGRNDEGGNYGFTAVEGWDAATGFGTPDYEALSEVVASLGGAGAAEEVLVV